MSCGSANVQLVHRLFEEIDRGDRHRLARAILDPDVVYEIPFAPALVPSRLEGAATVADWLTSPATFRSRVVRGLVVRPLHSGVDLVAEYEIELELQGGQRYVGRHVALIHTAGARVRRVVERMDRPAFDHAVRTHVAIAQPDGTAKVLERFLDAFNRLDVDAMHALLDPDVVWELPWVMAVPKLIAGRTQLMAVLETLPERFGSERVRDVVTHCLADDPGELVATWTSDVLDLRGSASEVDYLVRATVRDGRIVRYREYATSLEGSTANDG